MLSGSAEDRTPEAGLAAGFARRRLDDALGRLADGDRAAFDLVFAGAWPLLRSFAGRLVSPDVAEDVAQRVLLPRLRALP